MSDADAPQSRASSRRSHWIDRRARRGADIGAIVSAAPLMWVALGEASGLMQLLLVGVGVAAFAATRSRLPLPPLPRARR